MQVLPDEIAHLIPQGVAPPQDIPADIFAHAMSVYESEQRIDMRSLANDLGIARRTLYRKVRDRNHLLGEIHWFNSRRILIEALLTTVHLRGATRVAAVYEAFVTAVNGSPPLVKVMRDEPENTLKVITTKHGLVHGRVVRFMQQLLEWEQAQGHAVSDMPLDALAFAIVRIGESFLYAEILSGEEPDIVFSVEMVRRLLGPA